MKNSRAQSMTRLGFHGFSARPACFLRRVEEDDEVDEKRVVIVGHSRLGKTALWRRRIRGEFLATKAADPVYRLLGTDGLPVEEMPPLNHHVMGTMGHHVRSGGHALTLYDWERYMDFADKAKNGTPSCLHR